MRLSGFNSSLFNYMNGGNSNSFLSSLYGTNRTSSMFGTKNTGRYGSYGSYGTNLNRYGSTTKKYNNITSYYEKMAYSQVKKGAEGVREHGENLSQTGDESLFGKAVATGNTKDVAYEINRFVDDYNSMLTNMKKIGGSVQNIYAKQFATQAVIHRDELSKIGITASKDGTLNVNQDVLKNAGIDDMKKVFQGSSSFAGQAAVKSIYVESSAVSNLSANPYTSYNRYGTYGNSSTGSYFNYDSYGGYSANSFGSIYNSFFNSYF